MSDRERFRIARSLIEQALRTYGPNSRGASARGLALGVSEAFVERVREDYAREAGYVRRAGRWVKPGAASGGHTGVAPTPGSRVLPGG